MKLKIKDIKLSNKYLLLVCVLLLLGPILDLWVTKWAVDSMPTDEFLKREAGAKGFKHQLAEGNFNLWFLSQFVLAMWLCGGLYYFNNVNRDNYKLSSVMVVALSLTALTWSILPFLSWRVI